MSHATSPSPLVADVPSLVFQPRRFPEREVAASRIAPRAAVPRYRHPCEQRRHSGLRLTLSHEPRAHSLPSPRKMRLLSFDLERSHERSLVKPRDSRRLGLRAVLRSLLSKSKPDRMIRSSSSGSGDVRRHLVEARSLITPPIREPASPACAGFTGPVDDSTSPPPISRVHFWSGFAYPRRLWPCSRWDYAPRGSKQLFAELASRAVFVLVSMLSHVTRSKRRTSAFGRCVRARRSMS